MGTFRGLKGHESTAQALAWIYISNKTALTRRYFVAPCRKNTRFAGLEVLKGRQIWASPKRVYSV
jgi:hypothetical protein